MFMLGANHFVSMQSPLCSYFFFYRKFATVIAALTTNGMKFYAGTTVRANTNCGCYCFVMSPSLVSSGLRMSSLRMCHFTIALFVFTN
jgi:hypothetical protein